MYSENDTPCKPGTPPTPAREGTSTEEVGGLIRLTGRKVATRKAKKQVVDPVLELVTREMSTLGGTNVKNSTMFELYILAQEKKAGTALKAVELRDR